MSEKKYLVDINMGGNKITALKDPTSNQDAATKKYVDDIDGTGVYLPLAGGEMEYNAHLEFNDSGYGNYLDRVGWHWFNPGGSTDIGQFGISTNVGANKAITWNNDGEIGIGDDASSSHALTVHGKGKFTDTLEGTSATFSGLITSKSLDVLGITAGNYKKLNLEKYVSGNSNVMYLRQWAVRNANGSDWATVNIREGISVDTSYGTPTNSRSWWDRDPQDGKHIFGDASNSNFTMFGDGSIESRGIAGIAGARESGFALKVNGKGKFTNALTGTSATFTKGATLGDGTTYAATMKSSSGSRGMKLLSSAGTTLGGLDWNATQLFFKNSSNVYVFKVTASSKIVDLYGELRGTSAAFTGRGKFGDGVEFGHTWIHEIIAGGAPVSVLKNTQQNGAIMHVITGASSASYVRLVENIAGSAFGGNPEMGFALKTHGKIKSTGNIEVHGDSTALPLGYYVLNTRSGSGVVGAVIRSGYYGGDIELKRHGGLGTDTGYTFKAYRGQVGINRTTESGYALSVSGKTKVDSIRTGTTAQHIDIKFWKGTQAQYNAISTKNSNTQYNIVG